MPKKSLNQKRKDKYYRKAKEQHYRSRAAFKLIQLNGRYEFFKSARAVVDLCAAPGGWLQVARKHTVPSAKVVGVDLAPIRRINGVETFTGDITHRRTSQTLLHLLRGRKADIVLHDGAPNMGQSWIQDAYTQNELVLASVKLCTQILRKGGTLLTKAFRSRDYNSLQFILNKFFEKVDATKPPASRNSSAEIYLVCLHYKDPTHIDPELLNPQSVFKDSRKPKKSLKQWLRESKKKKTRNRSGYDEDYTIFYKSCTIADFVMSNTPIHLLMEMYEITFDDPENAVVQLCMKHPLTNEEFRKICEDLKVIGDREFRTLMKYRKRLRRDLNVDQGNEEEIEPSIEVPPPPQDRELGDLENELRDIEKKISRRERRTLEKTLLRRRGRMPHPDELFEDKEDIMDTFGQAGPEGGLFSLEGVEDPKTAFEVPLKDLAPLYRSERDKMKKEEKKWKEELDESREWLDSLDGSYDQSIEEDMNEYYQMYEKERMIRMSSGPSGDVGTFHLNPNKRSTHAQKRMRDMDKQLQLEKQILYTAIRQERMEDSQKMAKSRKKKKASSNPLILRLKDHAHNESSDDEEDNDVQFGNGNDNVVGPPPPPPKQKNRNVEKWFSQNIFEDDLMNEDEDNNKQIVLVEDGDDVDGDNEGLPTKKQKLTRNTERHIQGGVNMAGAGGAPVGEIGGGLAPPAYDDDEDEDEDDDDDNKVPEEMYDENTGSVALGIAKKMLLDKELREEWIDGSYNRFAHNDISQLPEWFQRDFNANTQREVPLTKEDIISAKQKYRELNSAPIRKVAEVEFRKKRKKFLKKKSMVSKANRIANEPELPNSTKIMKLQKLYNSFSKSSGRRKVYKTPGKAVKRKRGSKVVFVDRRLRADKREKKNQK